jgi:hypothetical protein
MWDPVMRSAARRCDDVGFAALLATAEGLDTERVFAALAGDAPLSSVPAGVAEEISWRRDNGDPDAAAAALARGVADVRADQAAPWVATLSALEVTDPLDAIEPAHVIRFAEQPDDVMAQCIVDLVVARPWPVLARPDATAVATLAMLVPEPWVGGFTDVIAAALQLPDPWPHMFLAAAAAATGIQARAKVTPDRLLDAGVDATALLAAARWVRVAMEPHPQGVAGPDGRAIDARLASRLARWAVKLGAPLEGPQSLAWAFDVDFDAVAGPASAGDSDAAAEAAGDRTRDLTDLLSAVSDSPACYDEVLTAAVRHGPAGLGAVSLERSSPALPARVALASQSATALRRRDFVHAVEGRYGHRWSEHEVLEAFAEFAELADVVLGCAPAVVSPLTPRWFIAASARRIGLGRWLDHPRVAEEFATATRGASMDLWRVMAPLTMSFGGMPDELVAVCDELVPSLSPAPA